MKRHQILLLHIATSILVLFPFPIHAHKMMYQDSIEIVVHRGANHIAPENTIPSALAALEHGARRQGVDGRLLYGTRFHQLIIIDFYAGTCGIGKLCVYNICFPPKLCGGMRVGV